MDMAREKTKEILLYYGHDISISKIAVNLGVSRNTVSRLFQYARMAESIILDVWNGEKDVSLSSEQISDYVTVMHTLRSRIEIIHAANMDVANTPEAIRKFFSDLMSRISNDELNDLFFPSEKKNDITSDMNLILDYLTGPNTNLSDSYEWAKLNGLKIADHSKSHYQKLFRDFRKNKGISDRGRFKPGEIMEIRWYRLETNLRDGKGDMVFPASASEYTEVYENAEGRKGRWLFIAYFPFSRIVSMRVYHTRCLDNMVEAINGVIRKSGSPKRLVSDSFRTDLVELTRDWPLFTLLLNTYGMSFIKDDSMCAFESMEKKLISDIRDYLENNNWYRNINGVINQLEESHNSRCPDSDTEKKHLNSFSENLVQVGVDMTGKYNTRLYAKHPIVQHDSHVKYADKKYSCPYTYARKRVLLCRTMDKVMMFDEDTGVKICEHEIIPRSDSRRYSTIGNHMPETDEERLKAGMYTRHTLYHQVRSKNVRLLCDRFLDTQEYEEQGYEKVRMLIGLLLRKNSKALEKFCADELTKWDTDKSMGFSEETLRIRLVGDINAFLDKAYNGRIPVSDPADTDDQEEDVSDNEDNMDWRDEAGSQTAESIASQGDISTGKDAPCQTDPWSGGQKEESIPF